MRFHMATFFGLVGWLIVLLNVLAGNWLMAGMLAVTLSLCLID